MCCSTGRGNPHHRAWSPTSGTAPGLTPSGSPAADAGTPAAGFRAPSPGATRSRSALAPAKCCRTAAASTSSSAAAGGDSDIPVGPTTTTNRGFHLRRLPPRSPWIIGDGLRARDGGSEPLAERAATTRSERSATAAATAGFHATPHCGGELRRTNALLLSRPMQQRRGRWCAALVTSKRMQAPSRSLGAALDVLAVGQAGASASCVDAANASGPWPARRVHPRDLPAVAVEVKEAA